MSTEPRRDGEHQDARGFGLGAGAVLGGLLGGRSLRLLTRVALARLLGAAALGVFDLVWTVVYLLSFIAPLGLHTAVVRFGAPLWSGDRGAFRLLIWRSMFGAIGLGTLLAAGLFVLAAPLAGGVFGQPGATGAFRIMALLIPLAGGLAVMVGATQAMQSMRHTAYLRDLLAPAVQLVLFLVFYALGYGLGGIFWATVVGFSFAFLVSAVTVRRLIADVGPALEVPPAWGRVLAFSVPVALANMVGSSMFLVDRLIVGALRPAADLGVYSAAAQLSILLGVLLSALTTAIAPRLVSLFERGEHDRLQRLFQLSTRWGICLIAPVAALLVICPGDVLVGLFGAEFAYGGAALRVLVLGQFANAATGPVGIALMTAGSERLWVTVTGVALVLNVVLDFMLLPRWGIMGAAVGSAIGLTLLFTVGAVAAWKRYDLKPFSGRSLRIVPILLAAAVGPALICTATDLSPLLTTILAALTAGLGTLAALAAFGLEPEDREVLGALQERIGLKSN